MKITVITGSPHRQGTTDLLASEFIRGAKEAGHEVFRFDAAFENIHPCLGCGRCGAGTEKCVQQDDMEKLYPHLLEAELVAFVTPLYFHGPTSQLKMAWDRFMAVNSLIVGAPKQAVLIAAGGNERAWVFEGLKAFYETDLRHLTWKDRGQLFAVGCRTRELAEKSPYPEQAYRLGKEL